jgi:uncharacterized Zn ribbon protein
LIWRSERGAWGICTRAPCSLAVEDKAAVVRKDINGNVPADGDSVVLIEDLRT